MKIKSLTSCVIRHVFDSVIQFLFTYKALHVGIFDMFLSHSARCLNSGSFGMKMYLIFIHNLLICNKNLE